MNMEITLSPEQVKLACVDYLKRHNMIVNGDVKFDIKHGYRLVGLHEHNEPYAQFRGVTASVTMKTSSDIFVPGEQ